MDYGRLLSRSFQVMWRYRALWLFGILFALTGEAGSNVSFQFPGNWSMETRRDFSPSLPSGFEQILPALVVVLACVVLIWIVLGAILRVLSRGALIGLVQELETAGSTPTVRRGFAIGRERFWSLLGIALLVNVPLALVTFVLILAVLLPLLLALIPLISSSGGQPPSGVIGLVVATALGAATGFCFVGLAAFILSLIIRPLYEFFVRVCVIQKQATVDSIREGFRLARTNMGKVVFLYILAIGIGIAFGIVMLPVTLLLLGIPSVAAIATYLATNSFGPTIAVAAVLGIPALLVLLFVSGLYRAYESTFWTVGFLAITAPPVQPAVVESQA